MGQRLDMYDRFPQDVADYLSMYGWHFSKKMCEWAVSKMTTKDLTTGKGRGEGTVGTLRAEDRTRRGLRLRLRCEHGQERLLQERNNRRDAPCTVHQGLHGRRGRLRRPAVHEVLCRLHWQGSADIVGGHDVSEE